MEHRVPSYHSSPQHLTNEGEGFLLPAIRLQTYLSYRSYRLVGLPFGIVDTCNYTYPHTGKISTVFTSLHSQDYCHRRKDMRPVLSFFFYNMEVVGSLFVSLLRYGSLFACTVSFLSATALKGIRNQSERLASRGLRFRLALSVPLS